MQPKRSKYDTNPLDGNVAEHADRDWGRDTESPIDPPTQAMSGTATREIGRTSNEAARSNPETEAPTRRMDDSYPSVFAYGQPRAATYQPPRMPDANIYQPPPVPPPNIYQPPPMPVLQSPGSRKVSGVNISEKWANVLPYCPFFIGLIAGVVELLLVPRAERQTRFHAAQGFALQIVILAISAVFSALQAITDSGIGSGLFRFAAFAFLIVSIVRVAKGKPHHIAPLDPATTWFEEKISPKK
jgi:uncharacterized membrane protein